MAKKKITQLDPATSVNSDALFPLSQEDNNEEKTFKGTIEQLGDYINKSQDFNTLNTTSKKVIGAINEVLAGTDKDIINAITTPAPIMSFSDGGDNIPVNKLLVAVTAQQAGTGTPAPDNVRAITGWSGAKVTVCGKNLFSSSFTIGKRANASTGVIEDYANSACTDYMLIPPSSEIDLLISGTTDSLNSYISFYDGNKTYIDRTSSGARTQRLLEQPENARYCVVTQVKVIGQTADISVVSGLNVQIELQSTTPTTYEAYKGTTVTIAFGQTVYGGVLDVTNGKLTIDRDLVEFDGSSDETWNWSPYGSTFFITIVQSDMNKGATQDGLCNRFPVHSDSSVLGVRLGASATSNVILFDRVTENISGITDLASWKTWLSNNPVQIDYPLAEPIEINLTPEQIATLAGLNNIYADCGDIQLLEYFNENANEVAELNRAMSDDFHIYSTAEQIVGKWMGDDLYEKSYHYTQATVPAQNTAVVIDNAISNLNLASLVDMTCVYKLHHTSQNYDVWYHGGMANTQLDFNTGNLLFYQKATTAQQNYNNLEVNITIRYTKAS